MQKRLFPTFALAALALSGVTALAQPTQYQPPVQIFKLPVAPDVPPSAAPYVPQQGAPQAAPQVQNAPSYGTVQNAGVSSPNIAPQTIVPVQSIAPPQNAAPQNAAPLQTAQPIESVAPPPSASPQALASNWVRLAAPDGVYSVELPCSAQEAAAQAASTKQSQVDSASLLVCNTGRMSYLAGLHRVSAQERKEGDGFDALWANPKQLAPTAVKAVDPRLGVRVVRYTKQAGALLVTVQFTEVQPDVLLVLTSRAQLKPQDAASAALEQVKSDTLHFINSIERGK